MNDVLEQRESSIEEHRKGISMDGTGTGAAFFVNGIFQGFELFERNLKDAARPGCRQAILSTPSSPGPPRSGSGRPGCRRG